MRRIHLVQRTFDEILTKIFEKWSKDVVGEIYSIYKLWDRNQTIKNDDDVQKLNFGEELEIIFENPASQERGSYSQWYNQKKT